MKDDITADGTHYILNRLLSTVLNTGGVNRTLVQNYYDGVALSGQGFNPCGGGPLNTPSGYSSSTATDFSPPIPVANRGLVTGSVTLATTTCFTEYWIYGSIHTLWRSDGTTVTASADAATNYAAPQTITSQSYSESINYNGWLAVTQTTGANGEQLSMTYDSSTGRPASGTSPFGAVTLYTYSTGTPYWQTQTGPSGVTTTTLDGVGRAIRVARGDSTAVKSYTDTEYAPCACSPLGKLKRTSQPYPAGGSVAGWTTYTYDGLGRTLNVQQPDGASTTTYSYAGNQTTVTDPAGKWKQFTTDALGNLVSVTEPAP